MVGQVGQEKIAAKFHKAINVVSQRYFITTNELAKEIDVTYKTAKKYLEIMERRGLVDVTEYHYRSNIISKNYYWRIPDGKANEIELS